MMMDFFGGTSALGFAAAFDEAIADPSVKGVVIDVDSPGGVAYGVAELSKRIYDGRDQKPIVAVSNMQNASAAYWISSSAHRVFASPSSETGSIGVWSAAAHYAKALEEEGVHVQVWRASESPNKAPFLPWVDFTEEAIADEQANVDRVYRDFRSAVARNRGISESAVQSGFGQGKMFDAQAAVSAGLADRIATLETVVRRMESGKLTLTSMENLEAAFSEPEESDESWRGRNEMERRRSELRRQGVLS
jgi:signal peptide peptidase SppA